MSFYRRFPDGRTQRWEPYRGEGEFVDCAADEPETRIRKPNEGIIVAQAARRKRLKLAAPSVWAVWRASQYAISTTTKKPLTRLVQATSMTGQPNNLQAQSRMIQTCLKLFSG
jgi:hypothetical protein